LPINIKYKKGMVVLEDLKLYADVTYY